MNNKYISTQLKLIYIIQSSFAHVHVNRSDKEVASECVSIQKNKQIHRTH